MNHVASTIPQLIEKFAAATANEQAGILKHNAISVTEFEQYATWSEEGYTRNCIFRNADFEFILLCWQPGAITAIHGHGGQDCWVYQVDGEVQEERFDREDNAFISTAKMVLRAGRLSYMNDQMGYHAIQNTSTSRAMTLHIYASPIERCMVFNPKTNCFEVRELEYDSVGIPKAAVQSAV
ncbi:MAG: cysteine dioxygenase family protein [Salibacteraceae bacterium]